MSEGYWIGWKWVIYFRADVNAHAGDVVVSCFKSFFAGVTILLSLTVFLNLVAEKMPTTSDAVPLIGTLSGHSISAGITGIDSFNTRQILNFYLIKYIFLI